MGIWAWAMEWATSKTGRPLMVSALGKVPFHRPILLGVGEAALPRA
jgi:hypothetical protein